VRAVLLAGGKGTRLHPFTAMLPKVLVPLDGVPVIELLIAQLRPHGVTDLTVVTGHLAEMVQGQLGRGERFGVRISYFRETVPLGTAGCLAEIPTPREPFLVVNGDLLTDFSFTQLACFHRRYRPIATIGTTRREINVDFGVIESDRRGRLSDYLEKPAYHLSVSMGIYCFDPRVCSYVTAGEPISMPELMLRLRDAGEPVLCLQEDCYWLDIGRPDDYARAREDFARDRPRFLFRRAA
jgi:NDP-sugar pyrophosphorylase family protein